MDEAGMPFSLLLFIATHKFRSVTAVIAEDSAIMRYSIFFLSIVSVALSQHHKEASDEIVTYTLFICHSFNRLRHGPMAWRRLRSCGLQQPKPTGHRC